MLQNPPSHLQQDKYPDLLGDVRGSGLLWTLELVTDARTRRPCRELARSVMFGLKEKRKLVGITGPNANILLVTPPMCMTVENCRE